MGDVDLVLHYLPVLASGAVTTLQLSSLSLVLGTILGLVIGLARTSHRRTPRVLATGYVELFRSIPILLQLFFIYYALPILFRLDIPSYPAAIAALSIYCSAYMAEVVRTGIQSVAVGQWEAAASLGMDYLTMLRYVVIPQAVRVAIPPAISVYVFTIKDSSLASVIGYVELTGSGLAIRESAFGHSTFGVLMTVAGIYFLMAFSLSLLGHYAHRRVRI